MDTRKYEGKKYFEMRKFFYRLRAIPIDLKKSGLMVVVVVVLLDMLEKN